MRPFIFVLDEAVSGGGTFCVPNIVRLNTNDNLLRSEVSRVGPRLLIVP